MKKYFVFVSFLLINTLALFAQKQGQGSISGIILDKSSGNPVEFANVIIQKKVDNSVVQNTVTNGKGQFFFENIVDGEYKISYSFIGFEKIEMSDIVIDPAHRKINFGKIFISETSQTLNAVEVTAQKSTFIKSIDRKVFNVGEDLMSKTGTVSDLLQSVPSVEVDIDGNVSLRGSENVMILVNGKPSAMMGANRAAVLQQMPASSIERIEVITNPSAKYKPDGTSGIINIVLKKNKNLGLNAVVAANLGNGERYNGNVSFNYNPGKINIYGSYSLRQDYREQLTNDFSKHGDTTTQIHVTSHRRPLSQIASAGIDYKLNEQNKIGFAGNYNYRNFIQHDINTNLSLKNDLDITDKDRLRYDPEYEGDLEMSANYQHSFAKEGHELSIDFTTSKTREKEDNHYTNIFRIPIDTTYDNTLFKNNANQSQFSVEYVNPITENAKFEAGYIFESLKNDMDFSAENFNMLTNIWDKNVDISNRFIRTQNNHVLYATYEHSFNKFGFLAGLRSEQTFITSNLATKDTSFKDQYFRLYPTLHLSYKLSDIHELQVNYSHRIRRPEEDDANPFPEYQDPLNLRAGNPHLKPEDINSIEIGYEYKKNSAAFISTLYYRYSYNGMTDVTKFINDSVRLTTKENLAQSNSAGMEFIISTGIGKLANVNFSTNVFYNTIDASSLGFSKNKSAISFSANLSAGINLTKRTVLQITSNYTGEKLTPQGKRLPSYVLNMGFRQEFLKKKAAFIFTVSDLFNSLRNNSMIDTPELYQKVSRKRSARVMYVGLSYSFGGQSKKQKDNSLKFDNQL